MSRLITVARCVVRVTPRYRSLQPAGLMQYAAAGGAEHLPVIVRVLFGPARVIGKIGLDLSLVDLEDVSLRVHEGRPNRLGARVDREYRFVSWVLSFPSCQRSFVCSPPWGYYTAFAPRIKRNMTLFLIGPQALAGPIDDAYRNPRIPPGFMMLFGSKCFFSARMTSICAFPDVRLEPGREHPARAVVVARRPAVFSGWRR